MSRLDVHEPVGGSWRNGRQELPIDYTFTGIARTGYVAPTGLAAIYMGLGRLRLAASELARAQREGDWQTGWALVDPRWTPLRGKLPGI